jgi:hypothetical protein
MEKRLLALRIGIDLVQYFSSRQYSWLSKVISRIVDISSQVYEITIWSNKKVAEIRNRLKLKIELMEKQEKQRRLLQREKNDEYKGGVSVLHGEEKYNLVSMCVFEEHDAIVEAVDDVLTKNDFIQGTFVTELNYSSTFSLSYLFSCYPFDLGTLSNVPTNIELCVHLFETYCCVTTALATSYNGEKKKEHKRQIEKLFKEHSGLMKNFDKYHISNPTAGASHWDDYFFKHLICSNLTTGMLDEYLDQRLPRELLSIIISYDVLCDDRLLEHDVQKLVYSRMKTCFSI